MLEFVIILKISANFLKYIGYNSVRRTSFHFYFRVFCTNSNVICIWKLIIVSTLGKSISVLIILKKKWCDISPKILRNYFRSFKLRMRAQENFHERETT
jgi:hypothetical protein